jgi:hypothetical protein
VIAIVPQTKTVWFGNISRKDQYQLLLDWAARSKNLGRTVDIRSELLVHELEDPMSMLMRLRSGSLFNPDACGLQRSKAVAPTHPFESNRDLHFRNRSGRFSIGLPDSHAAGIKLAVIRAENTIGIVKAKSTTQGGDRDEAHRNIPSNTADASKGLCLDAAQLPRQDSNENEKY